MAASAAGGGPFEEGCGCGGGLGVRKHPLTDGVFQLVVVVVEPSQARIGGRREGGWAGKGGM